jgi:hypothetical protein
MDAIDIGEGRSLTYIPWSVDRSIPALRIKFQGISDVERYGALIEHRKTDGHWCSMFIIFDTPESREILSRYILPRKEDLYQVKSWDPLTLSTPLRCACGDRGAIEDGRWVSQ